MSGVTKLLKPLREGNLVKGQAVGLAGPNNGVLETSVDLVPVELYTHIRMHDFSAKTHL